VFQIHGDSADDDCSAQEKVHTLLTDRQAKNSLSIISNAHMKFVVSLGYKA
jgi:hypothetical protein